MNKALSTARPETLRAIPAYLQEVYGWAYVTPRAVAIFERQWLVNLILWGNFSRLRDRALQALAAGNANISGRTLQVACVYGDLTQRLARRHGCDGRLDVIDVLPVQRENLKRKLTAAGLLGEVNILEGDSAALNVPTHAYDQALMFFLLHEQPEDVRRRSLAEVVRVLKPGGRLIIVDYHQPVAWHPLRLPMKGVLKNLEPFALDLWRHDITTWLPADAKLTERQRHAFFGGLYQLLEIVKA